MANDSDVPFDKFPFVRFGCGCVGIHIGDSESGKPLALALDSCDTSGYEPEGLGMSFREMYRTEKPKPLSADENRELYYKLQRQLAEGIRFRELMGIVKWGTEELKSCH